MAIEARGGRSDALGDVVVDVVVDVVTRAVSGERPVGSPFTNVTNAGRERPAAGRSHVSGAAIRGAPQKCCALSLAWRCDEDLQPFGWHKTTDEILERLGRYCVAQS